MKMSGVLRADGLGILLIDNGNCPSQHRRSSSVLWRAGNARTSSTARPDCSSLRLRAELNNFCLALRFLGRLIDFIWAFAGQTLNEGPLDHERNLALTPR